MKINITKYCKKANKFWVIKREISNLCAYILSFVAFSNFIIDSKPIQAKIDASIIEMKSNMNVDEVITDAIKGLIKW